MQRLAVAFIIVSIAAVIVTVVSRSVVQMLRDGGNGRDVTLGDSMPKIAFFLLLCLMAYAISTGAS
jgi:hypothetical protein